MHTLRNGIPALILLLVCATDVVAQQRPIRYTLSFPDAAHHYVEVEARYPADGREAIDLFMAVWTPGSYLLREYARNVESLTAASADGQALSAEKTSKNRWRVQTRGAAEVRVKYRVYSREMGVRTNWVEARFALINGAGTFISLVDGMTRRHEVAIELPAGWKTSISGLPGSDRPNAFVAADFDALIDSPIVAGSPAIHEFRAGGKPHYLVNVNEPPFWDVPRSVADVQKIVEQNLKFWGELPYEKYVFFNVLTESGGGLEHRNSTVMMASRFATRTPRRYNGWLGLVSHEYFHTWNVKRLRPIELGPFNYGEENYTRSLWISEGLTDYYGTLMLRRAGLISDEQYLESLGNDIEDLQTTPGRLVQPLETSSFDAWIKEYRRDENSPNVAISYYTKGAIVGFVLDAKIRRATAGARTLDDVMRAAYRRFGGARGFTPEEFRQLVNEIAATDLGDELRRALQTTEELDYANALDWYGLRFTTGPPTRQRGVLSWQGLRLRHDDNRLVVSQVRRDTPAYRSGINVDDEVVAMDDYRVRPDEWENRVEIYRPGDRVNVLVARRDELMEFELKVDNAPVDQWQLRRRSSVTPEQRERLRAWLEGT